MLPLYSCKAFFSESFASTSSWIVSEGIGIIGGAGTLYGIQEILKRIYPTLVEVKKISFNVYLHTFELGGGIVLGTFLTTIIWLENQRLSSLMQQEEKNQKFQRGLCFQVMRKYIMMHILFG